MTQQSKITSRHRPARMAEEVTTSRGWTLFVSDVEDDDCRKTHHVAVHQDTGDRIDIRFSSYAEMTPSDFERWLDLGRPSTLSVMGFTGGTFTGRDLELEWYRKGPHPGIVYPIPSQGGRRIFATHGLAIVCTVAVIAAFNLLT